MNNVVERKLMPICIDVQDRRCVVVGGGAVAERRAKMLEEYGADVYLISPVVTEGLRRMSDSEEITWIETAYQADVLDGAFMVVAATDDRNVNASVAFDAQTRGVVASVADEPSDGNAHVPAVIRRGALTIAVNTGGSSPTLTSLIRERLEQVYGPEWIDLVWISGEIRDEIQMIHGAEQRRLALGEVIEDVHLQQLIRKGHAAEALVRARECLLSLSE